MNHKPSRRRRNNAGCAARRRPVTTRRPDTKSNTNPSPPVEMGFIVAIIFPVVPATFILRTS